MVEVTDADREAVRAYTRSRVPDVSPVPSFEDMLAKAFAQIRLAGRLAEREAVVKWLLSDAARLDYEASGSEEHVLWWAADQVEAGVPFKID